VLTPPPPPPPVQPALALSRGTIDGQSRYQHPRHTVRAAAPNPGVPPQVTINRNASPSTPLQETLETLCATEQPLYTVRAHILDTTRPHLAREANATHVSRGFGRVWFWPGFLGRPEPLLNTPLGCCSGEGGAPLGVVVADQTPCACGGSGGGCTCSIHQPPPRGSVE
jgi:hypothetical protein